MFESQRCFLSLLFSASDFEIFRHLNQFCWLRLSLRFVCRWLSLSLINNFSVAVNARSTTNGMCAKNNTHIYVARTSNNRVIPIKWSSWLVFNNACEPDIQLIVVPSSDDDSDLVGWSVLLLAATVWSFA